MVFVLVGVVLVAACSSDGDTTSTSGVETPPAPEATTTTSTSTTPATSTTLPATTSTAVLETNRECGELFTGAASPKRAVITETDYAGNLRWAATINRAPGPLNANEQYVFAVDGNELIVLDRRACRIATTEEFANGSFLGELLATRLDDEVSLQNLDTGETLWTMTIPDLVRPHTNSNFVALMADPVRLVTIDEGDTITEIDVVGELGEAAVSDTRLFYADGTALVAIGENAQELWVASDVGEVEEIAETPIGVLVTTTENDWILFDLATGAEIAAGPEGVGELEYLEGDETGILVYSDSGFILRMEPNGDFAAVGGFIGQGGTAVDGGILFDDLDTGPPPGVEASHWLLDVKGEVIAEFTLDDPEASVQIEEDAIIISTVLVDDPE